MGGRRVNTVKTLKLEKGGGCMTPQGVHNYPAPMMAPPLLSS